MEGKLSSFTISDRLRQNWKWIYLSAKASIEGTRALQREFSTPMKKKDVQDKVQKSQANFRKLIEDELIVDHGQLDQVPRTFWKREQIDQQENVQEQRSILTKDWSFRAHES